MSETIGPSDLRMDDKVQVMLDMRLGVAVPLSHMVRRRASSFCNFFSGTVNSIALVMYPQPFPRLLRLQLALLLVDEES